jgi:4-amino-4-deoxy-L-arabinose transferase-like glycosyltransferase
MGRILNTRLYFWTLLVLSALLYSLPLGLQAYWTPAFRAPVHFGGALFAVLALWSTYRFGENWSNERLGLMAGAILASSLGFFALTQSLVPDIVLMFWTTLMFSAFAGLFVERSLPRARRLTYLLTLSAAGGLITFGWMAVAWPVISGLTVLWGQKRRMPQPRLPWKGAFVVGGVLAAPWFFTRSLQQSSFPYLFLSEGPFRAAADSMPLYLGIPVILLGFLPWTLFLPKAIGTWTAHRYAALQRDPQGALLIAGLGWGLLLFSLSPDRRFVSLMPLIPLLALLLANEFESAFKESLMPAWVGRGVGAMILVCVLVLIALKWPAGSHYFLPWDMVEGGFFGMMLGLGVFILVGVWGMRQTLACVGGILVVQTLLVSTLIFLVR